MSRLMGMEAIRQYLLGQLEIAESLSDEIMRRSVEDGNNWAIGNAFSTQGSLDGLQGLFRQAETHFEARTVTFKRTGERQLLAYALNGLGKTVYAMGNYAQAEQSILAALEIFHRIQDVAGTALSLLDFAKLHIMIGAYDKSEAYLVEGTALCKQAGIAVLMHYHNGWGMLERARGRLDGAIEFHQRSQRDYQNVAIHGKMPQTLNLLAAAEMALGDYHRAEARLLESLEMARTLGNISDQAVALTLLGEAKLAQDQPVEAYRLFYDALPIADRSGAAPLALQILCGIAQLCARPKTDEFEKAAMLWRYVAHHPATEADIRRRAEGYWAEIDANHAVSELTGQDIWRVVTDLQTG